ncbi:hypothetical protein CBR_g70743 [Chara braunii]|uniref:Uncharacterized protein n=1 Tax=Chara braunii TaxID=69332 RepID=A0A388KA13_CHABU|nr:hypothetical protein CBR_g70743 [Chara braunii]|eukprot:GBG66867.1 hypothetical protein CBR_g70743 [Chara braunii]
MLEATKSRTFFFLSKERRTAPRERGACVVCRCHGRSCSKLRAAQQGIAQRGRSSRERTAGCLSSWSLRRP